MFYKTSGDFIISGAVIAMQLVRDCNNRKTSNALLFALVAQQRFIILAPSAKSGNGSRKGTKELCCSQLFSDSWWRWDLFSNQWKRQSNHSPCTPVSFFSLSRNTYFILLKSTLKCFICRAPQCPSICNKLTVISSPSILNPGVSPPLGFFHQSSGIYKSSVKPQQPPHPSYNVGELGKKYRRIWNNLLLSGPQ